MLKQYLRFLLMFLCFVPFTSSFAAGDPNDVDGSKDPALFSRMPGFHIYNNEVFDFDRFEFPVASGERKAVEGEHTYVDYYANEGIKIPSSLQIIRNYKNAVQAIGGETLYEYEDGGANFATMKVAKDNSEVWAFVEASGNGMYKIHVLEKQLMNQAVTANADSMAGNLHETGRAAVYGIYFDTDKAVIKSESDVAITEIAKLLKNDSKIKLYVVGHTDNVGTFDHNLKLSQARAGAVVDTLVKKHAIATNRLTPFGVGPTAPITSNKSEDGRAKNRRVELVAQ